MAIVGYDKAGGVAFAENDLLRELDELKVKSAP